MDKVFRKEIKYIVSHEKAFHLQRHLRNLMDYDSYSGHKGYKVRSLYFDSLNNRDLYDSIDGLMEKRKTRLRIYSHMDQKVKLEYKCKSGSDCKKYSLTIPRLNAMEMMDGNYNYLQKNVEPLARTLYMRLSAGGYLPKTIVDYHRIAFTYPVSNVRIAFDSNVKASFTPYGFFDEWPCLIPVMSRDRVLLEIKYNEFLPGFLKKMVSSIDITSVANSKYSQSRLLI